MKKRIEGVEVIACKKCECQEVIKNGRVRGKQGYRCGKCGFNFVKGDDRRKPSTAVKKALSVILYAMGKASFSMLGKLFGHSRSLIYRWIVEAMDRTGEPAIEGSIKEMEFDEMWHFVGSKKTKNGSSRPWIVAHGEPLPGWSAIVMLQPSNSFTTKSST